MSDSTFGAMMMAAEREMDMQAMQANITYVTDAIKKHPALSEVLVYHIERWLNHEFQKTNFSSNVRTISQVADYQNNEIMVAAFGLAFERFINVKRGHISEAFKLATQLFDDMPVTNEMSIDVFRLVATLKILGDAENDHGLLACFKAHRDEVRDFVWNHLIGKFRLDKIDEIVDDGDGEQTEVMQFNAVQHCASGSRRMLPFNLVIQKPDAYTNERRDTPKALIMNNATVASAQLVMNGGGVIPLAALFNQSEIQESPCPCVCTGDEYNTLLPLIEDPDFDMKKELNAARDNLIKTIDDR